MIQPYNNLRAFLFFHYSATMLIVGFLPVYFAHKGLSGAQIGWLLGTGTLATVIFQPIWGYMSDRFKTIKRLLQIGLLCMLAGSVFLFSVDSFMLLIVAIFLFFSFTSPVGALGDSLAAKTAARFSLTFGSIRSWGSLGFAVTALFAGWILSIIGIDNILYVYISYGLLAILFSIRVMDVKVSDKHVTVIDAFKAGVSPRLLFFLSIILFISIGHRTNDNFISIYMLELGAGESLIGWSWFVAVASETLAFATSFYWLRRFDELTFLLIASIIYTLRWFLFAAADTPVEIIMLQTLHGLTFGIFYVVSFQFMEKLVPKELLSTGHLLFVSVFFGLSGIIGSLFGGWVIDLAGGSVLYRYLGYFGVIGCLLLAVYSYLYRRLEKKVPGGGIQT